MTAAPPASFRLDELDRDGRRLLGLRFADETWLLCGDPRRHSAVVAVPRADLAPGAIVLEGTLRAEPEVAPGERRLELEAAGWAGPWRLAPVPGDVWLLRAAEAPAEPLAVSAGGVVLRGRGAAQETMLVRPRGRRGWTLPKGTLEADETVDAAARREVAEETGLRARILAELDPVEYRFWGSREGRRQVIHKVVHWYRMAPEGESPLPTDSREIEEARWFAVRDAWAALHLGVLRGVLRQALRAGADRRAA